MQSNTVASIEPGKVPNVLLLGNGINRLYGRSSWDSIIECLSTGEYDSNLINYEMIKNLPYALQTIVVSSDSVSDGMEMISDKLMPYTLEKDQKTLLSRYLSIPFEAILTVNYSYEVECALNTDFILKKESASKYRKSTQKGSKPQEQFGLFKYFSVKNQNIWHIHGEAARPSSMVMGHYYYGKLLSEIQKRIPYIIKAHKSSLKQGKPFVPKCWIDYFLLGNVYIVGFGMDPSEMDIWWLVNCKKRHFSGFGNIFLFEPNLDDPKNYAVRALVNTFNISTFTRNAKSKQKYREFYDLIPSKIQDTFLTMSPVVYSSPELSTVHNR